MGKDPAFLFYPNDWIGGTMGMTFEEKGIYIDLLMMQFNRGHMTSHMIGQVIGQNRGQIWDKIKEKFEIDSQGKYFNRRLEEEQNKRKAFTESRRNNLEGRNQYTNYKKTVVRKKAHTTSRMENENENKNKNRNKKEVLEEKRIKLETRRASFTQEVLSHKEYPQDMLIAFANWWSEADKSYTKMKFEKQETWELDRRLNTWASRNKEFIKQPKNKYHATDY